MNQKLVDEFNKKLKAIDKGITFEITKKETVKFKDDDETVFELVVANGVPSVIINLDQPVVIDKDGLESFSNLIMLCGQYLEAFFGDSLLDD